MKRNVLVLLAGLIGCLVSGCSSQEAEDQGTHVLMIGNGATVTCMEHLPKIADDRGIDLDLVSLSIGGCTLKRHWENMNRPNKKPYTYRRNRYGKTTDDNANLRETVMQVKWDIIVLQQAGALCWKPESYEPAGSNLVHELRVLAPQAKLYIQEMWGYTKWDHNLERWGMTTDEMYQKSHAVVDAFAREEKLTVIPMGTAVQEWRKRLPVKVTAHSFGGDVVGGGHQKEKDQFKRTDENVWAVNSDTAHLNDKGEYFQSLLWAVQLFDVDLEGLEYKPSDITETEARLMREIAADVVFERSKK